MNPGTLPPGWTAATLLTTHESIPRNKVIAKALDWAGYVERSGHGTIIEKCEAQKIYSRICDNLFGIICDVRKPRIDRFGQKSPNFKQNEVAI